MEDINLLGVEEHVVQDQQMWRAVIAHQPHPKWENANFKKNDNDVKKTLYLI